jgi:large subunit ribosomal protein L4
VKIAIYNQNGEKLKSQAELPDGIFGVEPNEDLLAQYVRVYRANQRQGTAKAKTRGEVSGGGRKPWRQKGTGRARHGSIRSPLWVGGGTVHGPQPKDWSLKIPKNMKRKALFSALSQKLKEEGILVLNKLELKGIKTKDLKEILDKLPIKDKVLLALDTVDEKIILSARNLTGVKTIPAKDLNAYEVLNTKTLILPKKSLAVLEETFLGGHEKS